MSCGHDRIDCLRAPIEAAKALAIGIVRRKSAAALPGADRADLLATHVDGAINGGVDDQRAPPHLEPRFPDCRFLRLDCAFRMESLTAAYAGAAVDFTSRPPRSHSGPPLQRKGGGLRRLDTSVPPGASRVGKVCKNETAGFKPRVAL